LKVIFPQFLLVVIAIAMGYLAQSPHLGLLGVGLLGACLLTITGGPSDSTRRWAVVAAMLVTPLALVILPVTPKTIHALDPYHSVLAWLVGAAVSLSLVRVKDDASRRWIKVLAMAWAFAGVLGREFKFEKIEQERVLDRLSE